MKDWDYYNKPKSPYPNAEFKRSLLKEKIEALDEIPMTKKDREEAEEKAKQEVNEITIKLAEEYRKEASKLDDEFYQDCREDLGYSSYLNEKQCKILECYAYQQGHSCGYSEIYNYLIDLEEMVSKIIEAQTNKTFDKKK